MAQALAVGSFTFTVPVTAATYAPEEILFCGRGAGSASLGLLGIQALIEIGVATATLELWLLSPGKDPTQAGSFIYSGVSISAAAASVLMTQVLTGWPGAKLRCKSGGTAATATVSAAADY